MLIIKNLTIKNAKGSILLDDFSLTLSSHDKAAIIGEEGNGKSTLLKAVYDQSLIDEYASVSGVIQKNNCRIWMLSQKLDSAWFDSTICDYCLKETVDEEIAYERYNELMNLEKLCVQLRLDPLMLSSQQLIKTLSGGEKVKLQLLKLMSRHYDVLLLDEPTNDLDLDTLMWLERFMNEYEGALLYVSHDETLLSRTATRIILLEQVNKKTKVRHSIYNIGYDQFVQEHQASAIKAEQLANKEKEIYEKKREKLLKILNAVHDAQNSCSRQDPHTARLLKKKMHSVKSMEKRFEKESYTKLDTVEEAIDVMFDDFDWNPSKVILDADFCVEVADQRLIEPFELHVRGFEKVVFIGPNGCGKTTLMKQIIELLKNRGDLKLGIMPQNYQEQMPYEMAAVDFLAPDHDKDTVTRAREMLGRMKFTRDEMAAPIHSLSEGQKAKLFLLRFIMEQCNVLLLDEPTRNLSPMSNPALRECLCDFKGCILSVSHDRRYIQEVCTTIYQVKEKQLVKIDKLQLEL
ncbi:ATP-binding cassette domain-containing protein [Dielma fastidiosa]|uniref:ATP-binding cassette domain-containing protein n=1 Tax=Dielma fastidiosa TaxID=1034346 RepID=A0AB35UQB1_9FIRM|nr:ATP-binding cassette domain-containing protein [Dielma fastidiosa]MDY5168824.1 ATP-binding cassette domain-containing protein [Dielma fastidiosa]